MTQTDLQERRERYAGWCSHPVTQAFRSHLRTQLANLQDQWSRGHFTGQTADMTLQLNASALGQAEVLQSLIDSTDNQSDSFLEQT